MAQGSDLKISGFPWLPANTFGTASPNSLNARILCERHNNALHGLDSVALRFFRALASTPSILQEGPSDSVFLCNGHDLELWFLKMLCGMAVVLSPNRQWSPPERWVRLLFGEQIFAYDEGEGLYSVSLIGDELTSGRHANVTTIVRDSDDAIVGMQVDLAGVWFLLALDRWVRAGTAIIHPNELIFLQGGSRRLLALGWDDFVEGRSIVVRYPQTNATSG